MIQHQLQNVDHASNMMAILKEMFVEQNLEAKEETMRSLLNIKMAKGTLIRKHCLALVVMLNTLEVLGAEIDRESQVDIALQSLSNSFN